MFAFNCQAQDSTAYNDSFNYNQLVSKLQHELDSIRLDSIYRDTLVPTKIQTHDVLIYLQSKANQRKSLTNSNNPPIRKNLNNGLIFFWIVFILVLMLIFKSVYSLQYDLINKAWYNKLFYREFYETQTSVFKGSKFLTWFIISNTISLAIMILLKLYYPEMIKNEFLMALKVLGITILFFIFIQFLKFLFSFSFQQPMLNHDYAIIFRMNFYIGCLALLPILALFYYGNIFDFQYFIIYFLIGFILLIYSLSIIKFSFSGLFNNNQSSIFLILYLCSFEILPLLVLIKIVTKLIFNG